MDTARTVGRKPGCSGEHAQGQIGCNAGYEWWIAQQAKVRNPNVKLYGLQVADSRGP